MNLGYYSEDKLNICMVIFLLPATLCFFCCWFYFPLGAVDRLYYFIVAIPEPSLIGYKIIINRLTDSFCLPFEVLG